MINFELYKSKVITALRSKGFTGDTESFAESLDMSYEEAKRRDPTGNFWTSYIHSDLSEFMKENPEEFTKQH